MAIDVTCDRCGCNIVLKGKRLILYGWRGGYKSSSSHLDLCESCYSAVLAFVGKAEELTDAEDSPPY